MIRLKRIGLVAAVLATMTVSPALADGDLGYSAKAIDELEFAPIGNLPIEIAVLWGNPQEGESAFMLKYPPNFPGGMHVHSNAYHAVVVRGASKHWAKGESEADAVLQRPGDYWYQTGGQLHQDSFPTDEETILFIQFEGPADTTFVD